MSQFLEVVRYEFSMSIRRPSMWIAYGLLGAFYGVVFFFPSPSTEEFAFPADQLWQFAGQLLFYLNMFMTVLAGILAADRMQRDFRLGVRELQRSTPLRLPTYVLAKYVGVLASVLAPQLLLTLIFGCMYVVLLGAPAHFLAMLLVAFLAIGVPAHAFVVAFSLACPLVMPVRVYQVLFTGYWFWGNYLVPGTIPTISGTLLVPSGKYVWEGYFGGFPAQNVVVAGRSLHTATEATLNLLILAGCIAAALFVLERYLRWQAQRA